MEIVNNYTTPDALLLLQDPCIRDILVDIFSSEKNGGQESLFIEETQDKINIDNILNELVSLLKEGHSLYQRWTQRTDGKERRLSVPNKPLRKFIEGYMVNLIKNEGLHKSCHGGEQGWSVKKSLETHLPVTSAFSFDLECAFENIPFKHVFGFFYNVLDNPLPDDYKMDVAGLFSVLSTVNYLGKRGLPQGSPGSMALFNRLLQPLDSILYQKAYERGFGYSRWVDDMVISSSDKKEVESFLGAVELVENHFSVSKKKLFFQNEDTIYLLGHKIIDNEIFKNTKDEKLENKSSSLNFYDWFGGNRTKIYESWIN